MARQQRPTRATATRRRTVSQVVEELTAELFWQQALEIYQEPGMQSTLLEQQNAAHQNVNLNLLTIVLERRGTPLSNAQYQALEAIVKPFSAAHTEKLRRLRKTLCASDELPQKSRQQLKQQLLAAELTLEAEEQQRLLNAYHRLIEHPDH